MLAKDNEYMKKAFDRLRYISADEQKQLDYEARLVATMDHNYMMKQSREEGRAEGREEGREEGLQAKLKEQIQKKLQKGLTICEIAEMLEESEDTVRRIVGELDD